MRAVVSRVTEASVSIDGQVTASIGHGFLVLLGVGAEDVSADVRLMADRVCGLRVFSDETGKMNIAPKEAGAALLVVSNFTLFGDCLRSRRPGFTAAARPEHAKALYEEFVALCRQTLVVETGEFGADMRVSSVGEGPVTLLIDTAR